MDKSCAHPHALQWTTCIQQKVMDRFPAYVLLTKARYVLQGLEDIKYAQAKTLSKRKGTAELRRIVFGRFYKIKRS